MEQQQPTDRRAPGPYLPKGLTMEERDGLVNALKSNLKIIGGTDFDVHENLKPAVMKRVEVLRDIQSEHDELDAKFFEERAALEAKNQKLYAPLYSKRYDIVTGAVEVDGAKEEDAMDQTDDTAKGVPEFWLTAMKNNKIMAEEITERDEEALKYLKDIKWCRMDDPKGFKLEFFFDNNPFFTNSVLTKVYHMIDDDEPILEKAIGPPEVPDDAEEIEEDEQKDTLGVSIQMKEFGEKKFKTTWDRGGDGGSDNGSGCGGVGVGKFPDSTLFEKFIHALEEFNVYVVAQVGIEANSS
ncbi:nucleosome assembly protein 1;4-like protein isoform X2 [Tanacetum coccineum]